MTGFRFLEDLLTRADGTQLTVPDAVREYGYRTIWVAALNSAVRDRLVRPRLAGYPPRVFISYRWEDEESKAFARDVAAKLTLRGFQTLLDQYHDKVESHIDVPTYVSSIADAHYFLIIITDAYCNLVGPYRTEGGSVRDGWVWDEHQFALRLARGGLMSFVGFWKQGDRLPPGCDLRNTIDLRGGDDILAATQGRFFYHGIVLASDAQRRLIDLLEETNHLIASGDAAEALARLELQTEFAEFIEYRVRLANVHALSGHNAEALAMLEQMPESEELGPDPALELAGVFSEVGRNRRALHDLVRLSKTDHNPAAVHYLMGEVLREMGSGVAAENHARYSSLCLGRDSFDSDRTLVQDQSDVVSAAAGGDASRSLFTCDQCRARYGIDPSSGFVCGDCGSVYGGALGCPHCGNGGIVPLQLLFVIPDTVIQCPICRTGAMTTSARRPNG